MASFHPPWRVVNGQEWLTLTAQDIARLSNNENHPYVRHKTDLIARCPETGMLFKRPIEEKK